jgi:hypothetical protein
MRARGGTCAVVTGAAAGLMGTAALVGMRAFDERYASMTIADPRTFSLDELPLWLRFGRGVLAGAV